jgi:hypothetical protein
VIKAPLAASDLIRTTEYSRAYRERISHKNICGGIPHGSNSVIAIGHSRLVTNGRQDLDINNQPVITDNAYVFIMALL